MKVTLAVLLGCIVATSAVLNLDQRLDEANYADNVRSRRALCSSTRAPPTQAPRTTKKPIIVSACNLICSSANCNDARRINCGCRCSVLDCSCTCRNIMISKRDVLGSSGDAANKFFWPGLCTGLQESKCCRNRFPFGGRLDASKSTPVATAKVKNMASSLLNKFGKRADDSQFKKPSTDLVFLIDDSGSITDEQFKVAKEGAATMAEALCPQKFGTVKGTKQVSVVLFSSRPQTIVTFAQSSEGGSGYVEQQVMEMRQRKGVTATVSALRHVRENVLGKDGSRLNDPDTATVVFVITDGKCNGPRCSSMRDEARKLRETGPGVQVFAFGVGEADCDELEDIRGGDTGEVFGLPDYNLFEKLADAVKEEIIANPGVCA